MISELERAIAQKRVVSVFFLGEGGFRKLEPFCIGKTEAGIEVFRAFQVGGFSNTFTTYGWKLFRIDRIISIELGDEHFDSARPGYKFMDPAIHHVICKV
ncbi:MAG: hypothetical protein JW989_03915 [Chlorobiaceae bacterium]|jgi:hypothetical protein|nr:hypothetical protein [Chlorobiaceae bacterium]